MESRPRKRGRYNTHRRDVFLQKPKSTVYRQHHKARQLGTADDDQSSEEINDAVLERVTSDLILSNDSDESDPAQHLQDFLYLPTAIKNFLHLKTTVKALWI